MIMMIMMMMMIMAAMMINGDNGDDDDDSTMKGISISPKFNWQIGSISSNAVILADRILIG